jgi:hypothetical protein
LAQDPLYPRVDEEEDGAEEARRRDLLDRPRSDGEGTVTTTQRAVTLSD